MHSKLTLPMVVFITSATAASSFNALSTVSAIISKCLSSLGPAYSSLITHPFTLPTKSAAVRSFMTSISTMLDAVQGGYVPQTTATGLPGYSAAGTAATATRNAAPLAVLNTQLGIMGGAAVGVLGLAAWL